MQQNDYQEMLYAATKAEVSMANGDFQTARRILLAQKVPNNYILDGAIRWDLAQSFLFNGESLPAGVNDKKN